MLRLYGRVTMHAASERLVKNKLGLQISHTPLTMTRSYLLDQN
jgi:hypothetical protein